MMVALLIHQFEIHFSLAILKYSVMMKFMILVVLVEV